jgi:hypothetical protein
MRFARSDQFFNGKLDDEATKAMSSVRMLILSGIA